MDIYIGYLKRTYWEKLVTNSFDIYVELLKCIR